MLFFTDATMSKEEKDRDEALMMKENNLRLDLDMDMEVLGDYEDRDTAAKNKALEDAIAAHAQKKRKKKKSR